MQNNIKVALIEHRTGTLSEIPAALNQSELGFAYDANRLFIGNPNNEELSLRTTFPYQNVEILTEYSDLHNYISYRYINNIKEIGDITEPEQLMEREPFMVVCDTAQNNVSGTLTLNDVDFEVVADESLNLLAKRINARYEDTKVSVFVNNESSLVFICTAPIFTINATDDVLDSLGIPFDLDPIAKELPERKMTEKLDDNLHITDFGVNATTGEVVSDKVMTACIEIYNRYKDACTRKNIFFPAGTYNFDTVENISYSVPLISGTTLYGEGIDNTVFLFSSSFNAYCLQGMDSKNQYSADQLYTSEIISDIVIKDITLNCQGGLGGVYLRNMQNVRFENVRFICNGNVVKLFGDSADYKTKNITFDHCVFSGGAKQIDIGNYCENINIVDCRFEKTTNRSIFIDGQSITRVMCDRNIFTEANTVDYINYVGLTSTYVSFTNSKFDANVAEYAVDAVRPFNPEFGASDRNYTDTLDPTTDVRKVLRFHFTQPRWEYISQLIDANGVLTLNARRGEQPLEASDNLFMDLHITDDAVNVSVQGQPEEASLNIRNDKGDINVSSGNDYNVSVSGDDVKTVAGESVLTVTEDRTVSAQNIIENSEVKHTIQSPEIELNGEILVGGNVDLRSNNAESQTHTIYNSGDSDIILQLNNTQLARLYPTVESAEEYGLRAIDVDNAVVTSHMLQQFQGTIHGFATNNNVDSQGNIDIYDCSKYHSDNIVLKGIGVNFLNPPIYKPHLMDNGVFPYVYNKTYKENMIITFGGTYYRVLNDFVASVQVIITPDAIGTYLTEEATVYNVNYDTHGQVESVEVATDLEPYNHGTYIDPDTGEEKEDISYGFKYVPFSYDGVNLFQICSNNEEQMILMHDAGKDVEYQGEMYYCFTSMNGKYYIKDLPNIQATDQQLYKVIGSKIESTEPVQIITGDKPFKDIIDMIDIVLISTNPMDSSDISYYVLGRIEKIDETFNIACSPWETLQLAGRVPAFQPEQKYNTGDIVRYQGYYYKCLNDSFTPAMTPDEKEIRITDTTAFIRLTVKGAAYTFTGQSSIYQTDEENGTDIVDVVRLENLNLSKCRIVLRFFDVYGKHISVMNNTPEIENLNIGYFVEVVR